ncbi:MAG: transglutaminase-like domain-containing protein [Nocardioides sp.]
MSAGRQGQRRRRPSLLPSTHQVVDAGFLLALLGSALLGLASTYTGAAFAVVGTVGMVVGILLVHVTATYRWPAVAPVLLAVAVFYLAGGPLCLRADDALAPTPRTLGLLTDQVLFGWKDLLTTLPPVDGDGPLLVLPWVLGLASGVLGALLARISSGPVWLRAVLPLAAPVLLLAAVILLGVRLPSSVWVQSVAVAALGLTWLVVRAHRAGTAVVTGSGRMTRLLAGAALLTIAGAAAAPVGTWAAGGDDADRERVVLRTYVEPPFDVGRYPSPLASFRRYVEMPKPDAANLYDTVLFTAEGAPAGTRIRIATLDQYDGVVWGASDDAFPGSTDDTFQRVGSTLDNPAEGPTLDVRITLDEGYSGVWLPMVGALQTIDFETDHDLYAETFRYNLASSTGVVPPGLSVDDRYTVTAVVPPDVVTPQSAPSDQIGTAAAEAPFLDAPAAKWTEGVTDPMERVFAIADYLRTQGKYSDGVIARERIYRPGHFAGRLDRGFVNAPIIVGNDEQYAAAMALLANKVGVPARVVMGATLPEGGVVRGSDVSAWVELRVADGSWRVLPTETFMDTDRPADQQTQNEEQLSGLVIPPPAQVPPPSTIDEQTDAEITSRKVRSPRTSAPEDETLVSGWFRTVLLYGGGPLLAVLVVVAAILGAKLLRRSRRRSARQTSGRIVGAWRELVDHARDLGQPVPVRGLTRREQSALIASAAAPALARRADASVFGPVQPATHEADRFWVEVTSARRALSASVTRRRRLRAALSLHTFWRR